MFGRHDMRAASVGGGVSLVRYGEVAMVLEDDVANSPPLHVKALLLQDGSEPFLLGFEGLLGCAVMICDGSRRAAHLEFRAPA